MDVLRSWDDNDSYRYSQHEGSEWSHIHPTLFSMLGNLEGKKVVDYGCGGGKLLRDLISKGAKVYGYDISRAMIHRSRRILGKTANLAVIKSGQIPLKNSSIDAIVSNLALMIKSIFKEAYRVLVPGGKLVFCITHPTFPDRDFTTHRNIFKEGFNYLREGRPYQFVLKEQNGEEITEESFVDYNYSLSTYFNSLTQAGFRIENIREIKVPKNNVPPYLAIRGAKLK